MLTFKKKKKKLFIEGSILMNRVIPPSTHIQNFKELFLLTMMISTLNGKAPTIYCYVFKVKGNNQHYIMYDKRNTNPSIF